MTDRARLEGPRGDGTFKWCVFPCQNRLSEIIRDDDKDFLECRVPIFPQVNGCGASWRVTGGTPEAPTLSPSINCGHDACWHGFIVDGVVQNPNPRWKRPA